MKCNISPAPCSTPSLPSSSPPHIHKLIMSMTHFLASSGSLSADRISLHQKNMPAWKALRRWIRLSGLVVPVAKVLTACEDHMTR